MSKKDAKCRAREGNKGPKSVPLSFRPMILRFYFFGNLNNAASGSPKVRSLTVNVCIPYRGSLRFDSKFIATFGEYQYSGSKVTGASLPNTPGL